MLTLLGEEPPPDIEFAEDDLEGVEPDPEFDAARWVAAFEAHPGHGFEDGGPAYADPTAWQDERTGRARGEAMWDELTPAQRVAALNWAHERASDEACFEVTPAGLAHLNRGAM